MSKENVSVVICKTHTQAENAVEELQRLGFDMKKLSLVGKDYQAKDHVIGYYNIGDRVSYWGKQGAFWGGLWGTLFGSAFFLVPGIGPLVVAGPLVSAIVECLDGTFVVKGMSALGAGLNSLGVTRKSILAYETAIKSEMLVLVLHGSTDELSRATDILNEVSQEVRVPAVSISVMT
jgi:hypothetical protein